MPRNHVKAILNRLRPDCQVLHWKLIETPLKILHGRFEGWYQDEIGECFIKIKAFKKGVEEARGIKSTRKRAGYYLPVALNDPPRDDEGQPLYEFAAQGEKS